MTLGQEREQHYIKQAEAKERGELQGIPWHYVFPKLGSIIPALPKGYQIMLTGNSGTGKSQTWIGLFLYAIYKLHKEHPEIQLKIKLVIVLLEDTKEIFIDRLYSMFFYKLYKLRYDYFHLNSMRDNWLDETAKERLTEVRKEVDYILESCCIIDSQYNPTGMYKTVRAISNKHGEHIYREEEHVDHEGNREMVKVYDHYQPNDPTEHFFLIVDNLNNLSQESKESKLLTQLETINRWSRDYCRLQITKHWKWTVLNIQQQSSDSEKQQFTYKGDTVIEKVKPSLDGLGNSKEDQRDKYKVS